MTKKIAAGLLAMLLLLCPLSGLADEESGKVYQIVDETGETICRFAGVPEAGDEYISGDNRHFRITRVEHDALRAVAENLGEFPMPDVSWLHESAQPVSAQKKAVALYCTHSDESYKPTDGVSSDEERGGIYDVAEAFKGALEEQGITVYYSDDTYYPHDAGAYRRSRATAASLVEEGVDTVLDIHRDGIPDPTEYESQVDGEDLTKVRVLVGRSNQNAEANKQFAAQLKAVADDLYPGLIKDIYMGKGSYNQDLMSPAVLLEFGTYTNDKDAVLNSTGYMANVMNHTLYGGVTGAAGGTGAKDGASGSTASENKGAWTGIAWLIGILVVGALVYAFAATGKGKAALAKWKRTFQEMFGGLFGGKPKGDA